MSKRYDLTLEKRAHILRHGSNWKRVQLTQAQCAEAGFLPSRGHYYDTTVQRCGNVIKFTQNTLEDSSINTRYCFIQ